MGIAATIGGNMIVDRIHFATKALPLNESLDKAYAAGIPTKIANSVADTATTVLCQSKGRKACDEEVSPPKILA